MTMMKEDGALLKTSLKGEAKAKHAGKERDFQKHENMKGFMESSRTINNLSMFFFFFENKSKD